MRLTSLSSHWSFRSREDAPPFPQDFSLKPQWMPASIPGAVHLDLLANGIIPDPFVRCFERGVAWVDGLDWEYKCDFEWHPSPDLPNRVLRFDGLDTVCSIYLNGQLAATHDNMFTPLEVDVTERLQKGANELSIQFQAATKVGRERREIYFEKERLKADTPRFEDRAFVRKAQYMYGWDWGPRLISCGIWKPVHLLEYRSRIRRASFMQERMANGRFHVWLDALVEGEGELGAEFAGQRRKPGESLEFEVSTELWWPNGEGSQTLHNAAAFVTDHRIEKKIGLRTISLHQEDDAFGRSFEFEVNGRRLWARGANWIPNDSFLGRDREVGKQIEICKRLGMNMVRVWGGGFYESEEFYDACDAHGVVVWQDFPYACSYYPDGPREQAIAKAEAEDQVLRLRDRTSLAIWCGNNENLAMYEQGWGGREHMPPRYYGDNIYSKVLPEVVKELDPTRPYIVSSPIDPLHDNLGDAHYWDVWHGRGDWSFYFESKSRFCSEFGFASACSLSAWAGVLGKQDYEPSSIPVRWHDKTGKGWETFERYVELHYPHSETLSDWTYRSQLNQRDAFKAGIEHFRRSEFCKGALIWQFNDCWPVQSWAVQDYKRMLKPAGFELARVYAPILVSIEKRDRSADVHVINDSSEALQCEVIAEIVSTLDGTVFATKKEPIVLIPGERLVGLTIDCHDVDKRKSALRAFIVGRPNTTTWELLAEPKDTVFGHAKLTACVRGREIEVGVRGFVRDLVVWDEEDAAAIMDQTTGQPGWNAVTLANSIVRHQFGGVLGTLRARSLAGFHDIAL